MNMAVAGLETRRLALQEELDARRDAAVRNRMGQFATPTSLAVDIQRYAKARLGNHERLRFIDPAIGTRAFYSALLHALSQARIDAAIRYEIDPHYGRPATTLWGKTGLEIILEDFTRDDAPEASDRFNLLICNPPCVRHDRIDRDAEKAAKVARAIRFRRENLRSGRALLLFPVHKSYVDDCRRAGWLVDPQRIHGREVRGSGEALPARQGDASSHSPLRSE